MDQRSEIRVSGADDEGGDVVALEGDLDGIDSHLDVGGVLSARPHPLRDLDQLDVASGELLPGVSEHPPVGIRLPAHHPPPLGQGVGDGLEVELHPAQCFSGSDCQVLEVDEQGDALFFHEGQA